MNHEDDRDEIDKFLNLAPEPTTNTEIIVDVTNSLAENKEPVTYAQEDYEYARRQLRTVIDLSQKVLTDAAGAASQGLQPEHFEAVAQIIGAMVSANKELMGLSKTHNTLVGPSGPQNVTNNNNLFVGSTTELMRLLKKHGNAATEE
jgi:hypothetical protein